MGEAKSDAGRSAREARSSPWIARSRAIPAVEITADHGGEGGIRFRRLFSPEDRLGRIDFIDRTVVPAGSSIGEHRHEGNDEIYIVVSGEGVLTLDGQEHRVAPGDVAVTSSGSSHGLCNVGPEPLVMFVVQVSRDAT